MKETLEQLTVELSAKSGEGVYSDLSQVNRLQKRCKTHKIKVDKRKLELQDGIRTLGYTNVPVKLHPEVQAVLKVHVKEEA